MADKNTIIQSLVNFIDANITRNWLGVFSIVCDSTPHRVLAARISRWRCEAGIVSIAG